MIWQMYDDECADIKADRSSSVRSSHFQNSAIRILSVLSLVMKKNW